MNNHRIVNLSTLPGLSIDEIAATPNVAVNVSTMGNYITASLALNTAYCGPLFSTMSLKDKRVTDMADALLIGENDTSADVISKIKQGVNIGTLN
jgi:hypothetical protein